MIIKIYFEALTYHWNDQRSNEILVKQILMFQIDHQNCLVPCWNIHMKLAMIQGTSCTLTGLSNAHISNKHLTTCDLLTKISVDLNLGEKPTPNNIT